MGTLVELVRVALRGGFKTSEFWLAVLALVLPWFAPMVDKLAGVASAPGAPIWLALLGAAVAGAYAWARAHVKAATVKAAADAAGAGALSDVGPQLERIITAAAAHVSPTIAPPYPGSVPGQGGGPAAAPPSTGPTLDAGRAGPAVVAPESGARFVP